MDISNMYLNNKLTEPEYMSIHISLILDEIMKSYNPTPDTKGFCYVKIIMAIYGLKQSGALANKDLKANLAKHGYFQMKHTPGIFKHESRPINFILVVDDFGVLYRSKSDAKHLEAALTAHYPITKNWTGDKYIGIYLKWNYEKRELITSIKGYVKRTLQEFKHPTTTKTHNGPEIFNPPDYGQKQQMEHIDKIPALNDQQINRTQKICGKFLYLARAIDNTMQYALNTIAVATNKSTQQTEKTVI